MQPARPRLGQLLVEANILTQEQLEAVLAQQKNDSRKLGQLLVDSGLVSETRITQILSQQLSVPWVSLYHIDFSHDLLALVPRDIAEQYGLIPIYVRAVRGQGDTLYVAMEDPMIEEALQDCTQRSGLPTRAMIAAPSEIRRAIRIYYGASDSFRAARAATSPPVARATEAVAAQSSIAPARGREAIAPAAASAAAPAVVAVASAALPAVTAAPVAASAVAAPMAAAPSPVIEPALSTVEAAAQPASPPASVDDGPVLEVREIDVKKKRRKQVELTLLDGTTLRLPSASRAKGSAIAEGEASAAEIVEALRAAARGDSTEGVLGENLRWEKMMAVVLDLLLRKHLILERELIEALKRSL